MTDAKPNMPDAETSPFLHKWPRRIEGSRMLRLWVIMDNERQEALIPPSQIAGLFVVGENKTKVEFMNGATARLNLPLNEAYDAIYHENTTSPINDLRDKCITLTTGTEIDDAIYLGEVDGQDWFVDKKQTLGESFNTASARAKTLATPEKPWQLPPQKVLEEMFNNRFRGAFTGSYLNGHLYLSCEQFTDKQLVTGEWECNRIKFLVTNNDSPHGKVTRLVYAVPKI
jgi:hypothetical protein